MMDWCCSPMEEGNKRSELADKVTSLISDIFRKIIDGRHFTIEQQETTLLKFLWTFGKSKDLLSLAEKLLEAKKQIELRKLQWDKIEDDQAKKEEKDGTDFGDIMDNL